MPKNITIQIAEERQIYDIADVEKAISMLGANENPQLMRIYTAMLEQGGNRWLLKPSSTSALDWLYEVCPNFTPVIDDLKKSLHLAIFGNGPIVFTPMCIAGEPGVGKTHFAKCFAEALATEYAYINMASVSAGWVLSGAGPSWKGAKEGKVARLLVRGPVANPLFFLDEIDKVSGASQFDPCAALHELMESETNSSFTDEFLDLPLDCSSVLWLCAANEPDKIENAILKRLAVYEVLPPTEDQCRTIGQAIYKKLLKTHRWPFDELMTDDALDAVGVIAPREMTKRIIDALGTARVAGRSHVLREDFDKRGIKQEKRAMGFN